MPIDLANWRLGGISDGHDAFRRKSLYIDDSGSFNGFGTMFVGTHADRPVNRRLGGKPDRHDAFLRKSL